jgi:catalase
VFKLTESLEQYTRAKVLTEVDVETPVFVRFSTVAGGAGSVDTPRDVRGFAVKFYTSEGNWDLVGNNIPVFFIQDAIKFPDLVHSVKMEPDRGFPQAASAHDTFWDFVSLMPESMHMVMWAMSDRTLPRSLRMMEGFGVHSFRLINNQGQSTFVKFHWKPVLGIQSTVWDEAVKIAGADPDYHRRDLFEAIERGDFPQWELGVQLFTQEQADALPFDHLDATKLIPEEVIPVQRIGTLTLNRWPDNFFAETEQVAFLPTNLVPGIDFSDDPLLHGRLHSYLDTQLSRLGGPNFHQLPINQPKCPFHNLQRDGMFQMMRPKGRVAYEPNSLDPSGPRETQQGFRSFEAPLEEGTKARLRAETFRDHFSQARLFYRSQKPIEQSHIASALVFELSKVQTAAIRTRVMSLLRVVDEELAQRVADGLAMPLPEAASPAAEPIDLEPASSLSILDRPVPPPAGRCIGILFAEGSDAKAIKRLQTSLQKAGVAYKLIAPKVGGAALSDGTMLQANAQLAGSPSVLYDAIALVLTQEAAAWLANDSAAVEFVSHAFAHLKAICHTDEAGPLLIKAGVEADEFVFVADVDGAKRVATWASQRCWEREPKVRTLA